MCSSDGQAVIVIPAYRPGPALVDLVEALVKVGAAIVVVDDGSGRAFNERFIQVGQLPNVYVAGHASNIGKGAALRTGMLRAQSRFPELTGVVTADADGQHHPDDIVRVAEALLERPDALTLGTRTFGAGVPWRSRVGNRATRLLMSLALGQKLSDTQTGLRGIPATLIPHLLKISSTGYEYEAEMLIACHHLAYPIVEVPIRTIYLAGNESSHFRPFTDSLRVCRVLLREITQV